MKRLMLLVLITTIINELAAQPWKYPETEREDIHEFIFGKKVNDPYRWLEDFNSDKVETWAKNQETLLEDILHAMPERAALKKRIDRFTSFDLCQNPQRVGNRVYFIETKSGESLARLMVRNEDDVEELVLDPKTEFSEGNNLQLAAGLKGYWVSDDGSKLIYTVAKGQTRWYSARVRDLISGKDLTDEINALHRLGDDLIWDSKSEGFFYVGFQNDRIDVSATPEGAAVYYHRIGSDKDQRIFSVKEEGKWLYNLKKSMGSDYLIIEARNGSEVNNRVFVQPLEKENPSRELFTGSNGNFSFLGQNGRQLFFFTNLNAPKGRIVKWDLDKKELAEIIPEGRDAISAGSQVGGNAIGMFKDHFLVTYTVDGIPKIKCYDIQGNFKYDVPLPVDGSVWGGFSGNTKSEFVYYRFLGLTQPSTLYELNILNGNVNILKKAQTGFRDEDYVTKHVFYKSKDGTKIPMFITHKNGIELDGTHPAFMYAYGAFSWVSFLWYQPHLLTWLEMGGVYAQPSIRGGGEYGESWHQAGVGRNRQNAVDDYIAATEWLIKNGYTSKKNVVANGGSISSALAGNVLTQRPDLYGAVIIDRPALDMVRYDQFTTASYWVDELGSPKDSLDFNSLYNLSPYHQLRDDVDYPPVLLMAGDLDELTPPLHAYKFMAALQNTKASKKSLMLLKIMRETGHTFGSTPQLVSENRTDELAFLVKAMSLKIPQFPD